MVILRCAETEPALLARRKGTGRVMAKKSTGMPYSPHSKSHMQLQWLLQRHMSCIVHNYCANNSKHFPTQQISNTKYFSEISAGSYGFVQAIRIQLCASDKSVVALTKMAVLRLASIFAKLLAHGKVARKLIHQAISSTVCLATLPAG